MIALQPFDIEVERYNTCVEIIGAGDLHWASAESHHEAWWAMFREHPDAYYIFVGDLLHSISPADKRFGTTGLRKEFISSSDNLMNIIIAEVEDFVEKMKANLGENWIKTHIIGAVSGNHPNKPVTKALGFDPHDLLCKQLGIRNLGYSCMIPIRIKVKTDNSHIFDLMIYAHHGFGGSSRTEGGNITKYARHAQQFQARVFLYGHVHELCVKDLPPLLTYKPSKTEPWIMAEERMIGLCGSFQKTFSRSVYASYAEMKGFPARPLGYVLIQCFPMKKIIKGKTRRFLKIHGTTRSFYEL